MKRSTALFALACAACAASPAQSTSVEPSLDITPFARRVLGTHACTQLEQRFLPVELKPGVSGTAKVERCVASEAAGQRLRLDVAGILWEAGTFHPHLGPLEVAHLEQPATFGFEASVALEVYASYAPRIRMVTLTAMPGGHVDASLAVVGPLKVRPTTTLTEQLDRAVPLAQRIRTVAATEGRDDLVGRLARGATLTFDVASLQPDFALGLLPPGQRPPRPSFWNGATLVNEHVHLAGQGFLVRGPYEQPKRPLRIVGTVEQGSVQVRLACRSKLGDLGRAGGIGGHEAMEPLVRAAVATAPSVVLDPPGRQFDLSPPPCDWVAIMSSTYEAQSSAKVVIAVPE